MKNSAKVLRGTFFLALFLFIGCVVCWAVIEIDPKKTGGDIRIDPSNDPPVPTPQGEGKDLGTVRLYDPKDNKLITPASPGTVRIGEFKISPGSPKEVEIKRSDLSKEPESKGKSPADNIKLPTPGTPTGQELKVDDLPETQPMPEGSDGPGRWASKTGEGSSVFAVVDAIQGGPANSFSAFAVNRPDTRNFVSENGHSASLDAGQKAACDHPA